MGPGAERQGWAVGIRGLATPGVFIAGQVRRGRPGAAVPVDDASPHSPIGLPGVALFRAAW